MKNLQTVTSQEEPGKSVISQHKVFTRFDYMIFAILTVVVYAAIVYFMLPWFYMEDWFAYPLAFWILAFIFLSRISISQLRWWLLPFMKKPAPVAPRSGWRVGVATTFVPGAESLQMLEKTVEAMVAMKYPHDTWVLDEGNDPAVKELCRRLGAFYFSRKNYPEYRTESGTFQDQTKYGNYNSWLNEVGFRKYEIIAAFDPDHIPEPNFLEEVLGYFNDPKIGYVQAAQVYYNQQASFIARGAAEETYTYYSSNQMFCYAMGYPIITGCHSTHRTAALREVGGFAPHDADDLLITLMYRTSGWRGVYIPKILARGLTPVDWNSYFKQQLRWARSVLDIKFRIQPKFLGKLPFRETVVSLLHGLYYLQGANTFLLFLLIAYMLATGSTPKFVENFFSVNFIVLLIALVICDFYRQSFYIDRKNEWGLHWRAGLLQIAKYPYLILACWQVLLNRRHHYTITSKIKERERTAFFRPFLAHLMVAGLICTAWFYGVVLNKSLHPLHHLAGGVSVIGTIILAGTNYMKFPAPFDPQLAALTHKKKRRRNYKKIVPEKVLAGYSEGA